MANRPRREKRSSPRRDTEPAAPDKSQNTAPAPVSAHSGWAAAREWADAIVIAFVLAMFIRTFVVELFKIPSGSMTPTLIGDMIVREDVNGDGAKDLLVYKSEYRRFQVFLKEENDWIQADEIPASSISHPDPKRREDRILVNKFAYWLHPPERGDLIVFKVPEQIWEPDKAIYIKRAVGLGGETVSLRATTPEGLREDKNRLAINDVIVDEPPVFLKLRYSSMLNGGGRFCAPPGEIEYAGANGWGRAFERAIVPEGHVFAMGDNTNYSYDGRYWGTIPLENLKGKAFLRYWPLREFGFLK